MGVGDSKEIQEIGAHDGGLGDDPHANSPHVLRHAAIHPLNPGRHCLREWTAGLHLTVSLDRGLVGGQRAGGNGNDLLTPKAVGLPLSLGFHSFPCSQIALSVQLISLNIGLADLQHLGREQALTGVQTQMKPDVPIIRYST